MAEDGRRSDSESARRSDTPQIPVASSDQRTVGAAPRPGPAGKDSLAILRFAAAALVATALLGAVYGALVLTEPGQRLENLGLAGAELRDTADRQESLGSLSHISVLSFGGAILFVIGVGLVRRRPGLGLLIGAVMGISVVAAEVLKEVLSRPEFFPAPAWLLRNTFPSGHATVAAAIGIGAILVAPNRLRWVVVPVAAAYASTIGQATQIAGWHRLSGTIGGVLLVVAVASFALAVLADRGHLYRSAAGHVHARIKTAMLGVAGFIVLLAAVIAALPVAFPLLHVPRGADLVFVHTANALIGVGVTIAAIVTFGVLLEPFSVGRPEGAPASASLPIPSRP